LARPELASEDLLYHGIVKENEQLVQVSPPIRIKTGSAEVCHYRVTRHGELPLEVELVDKVTGEARIVVTSELNCERRQHYKFHFTAIGCDGTHSKSATVRVTVEDVNEYEPYFLETSYTIVVDEGRLYDRIVQVQAKDDDCSPDFGDICKYELENPAEPFAIDEQGYVKNTEPLDWGKSKNYILSVVAYDCGLKASKAVLVNIGVNRICSPQWQGIKEQVDYIPD
ncbi:PREDICTED: calsyntenin-1-like, partial [Priapulus caudatus]|uniref:Calsyntenin-1-like n=1 Tax=Priapulus caudatus TaxID=37621 RepID=A0ABM1F399_PRICU